MPADELPTWKPDDGTGLVSAVNGYVCDDMEQWAFATACALQGFDLPTFDMWLAGFKECPARRGLFRHRAGAMHAAFANDHDALALRLELLEARSFAIRRESFLLPYAHTGNKVRKPHERANKDRHDKADAEHAAWQSEAVRLWGRRQHADKSAADVARLIDPARWNTIRRHIRKP